MPTKYSPRSDDPWANEREGKKPWFSKISLSNLAEPAIIVAIITTFFYIFISGYYDSYFQRLSIPFYILDLPFTFYLYSAHWMLYILYYVISLIILIDILKMGLRVYRTAKGPKYDIIIVYISAILLTVYTLTYITNLIKNVITILFIVVFSCFWIWTLKDLYKKGEINQGLIVSIIIVFLVVSTTVPTLLGRISAENLIKGGKDSFEVKLDMKNENSDLLNRTLILVTHSNYKYYLVEKNESVPKKVKLFIIPDDQIKMIVVEPVGVDERPIYEFYKDWRLI